MPTAKKPAIISEFGSLEMTGLPDCAAVCRYLLARASVVGTMTSMVRTVQS